MNKNILMKPEKLSVGDKVAIISLSSGMLGEPFCSHSREVGENSLNEIGLTVVYTPNVFKGIDYLKSPLEKMAEDLKYAFNNSEIKGIICSIGGYDTYRALPFLMNDAYFQKVVINNSKIFLVFSDTTVNHLMLYKLGLQSFYCQAFMSDIAELASEMLSYSKSAFSNLFESKRINEIRSSDIWYDEKTYFSTLVIRTKRIIHEEIRGLELIQESNQFEEILSGGCLESLYEMLVSGGYND